MLVLIRRKKDKEDLIGETWRNGWLDSVGKEESARQTDRERERDRQTDGGGAFGFQHSGSWTAQQHDVARASLTGFPPQTQTLSVVLRFNLNNNLQQPWNKVKRWSAARWAERERDSPSRPNTCGGSPGRTYGSSSASTRTTNATCAATGRWRNSDPGWKSPACLGPPQWNGNFCHLSGASTRVKAD